MNTVDHRVDEITHGILIGEEHPVGYGFGASSSEEKVLWRIV